MEITKPQSRLHNPGCGCFLFPQFPPAGTYIFPLLFPYQWLHRRQDRMDMLACLFFRSKYSVIWEPDYALVCIFTEPDRDEPRGSRYDGCRSNKASTDKKIYVLAGFIFCFHSIASFYIELMFIITLEGVNEKKENIISYRSISGI